MVVWCSDKLRHSVYFSLQCGRSYFRAANLMVNNCSSICMIHSKIWNADYLIRFSTLEFNIVGADFVPCGKYSVRVCVFVFLPFRWDCMRIKNGLENHYQLGFIIMGESNTITLME